MMRTATERIISTNLSNFQWKQATLPIKHSGLGLICATDLANAAFYHSVLSTINLQKEICKDAFCIDNEFFPRSSFEIAKNNMSTQHLEALNQIYNNSHLKKGTLTAVIQEEKFKALFSDGSATPLDKARILSCSGPHSGAFLQVLPVPNIGTEINNQKMLTALKFRLGANQYGENNNCVSCRSFNDIKGDHAVKCGGSKNERVQKHDAVKNAIHKFARSAGYIAVCESKNTFSENRQIPGDVRIDLWKAGRTGLFDITITHPTNQTIISKSQKEQGAAAELAFKRKNDKFLRACDDIGHVFIPIHLALFTQNLKRS